MESYSNGLEIGRGLNEGLTNWVCEKVSGIEATGYSNLTNLVYELEVAIGPERVMSLPKGSIKTNVTKQLNLTVGKTFSFLAKADILHDNYVQNVELTEIMSELSKCQNDNLSDQEVRDKIQYLYNNFSLYRKAKFNSTDGIDVQLEYFKTYIEEICKQDDKIIEELESKIFEYYIAEDFYRAISRGMVSENEMKKFRDFRDLVMTLSSEANDNNSPIKKFLKEFSELEESFKQNIFKFTQNDLLSGNFSLNKFKHRVNQIYYEDDVLSYIDFVAIGLGKENSEDIKSLLKYLVLSGNIDNIGEFSITHAMVNGENVPIILRDGRPISENILPGENILSVGNKIDYQNAVRIQFQDKKSEFRKQYKSNVKDNNQVQKHDDKFIYRKRNDGR